MICISPCCCCCSITKSCPIICDPMHCCMPGFPVLHCFLEFAQICPSSRWCHPTISSSVTPFSSRLQSFPASESFQISQFFPSGGQSIGVLAATSVFPMNIKDWFPLGNGLVGTPFCPKDSQETSSTSQFKSIDSLALSFLYYVQLSHPHMNTRKTNSFDEMDLFRQSNVSAF